MRVSCGQPPLISCFWRADSGHHFLGCRGSLTPSHSCQVGHVCASLFLGKVSGVKRLAFIRRGFTGKPSVSNMDTSQDELRFILDLEGFFFHKTFYTRELAYYIGMKNTDTMLLPSLSPTKTWVTKTNERWISLVGRFVGSPINPSKQNICNNKLDIQQQQQQLYYNNNNSIKTKYNS